MAHRIHNFSGRCICYAHLRPIIGTQRDHYSRKHYSGIPSFIATQQSAQLQLVIIVVVVEALLAAVFAATFWYAIKCRDQCRTYPPP